MQNDNKALARRWFEDNWNARREAVMDELLDPAVVGRMEGSGSGGLAEFRQGRKDLIAAFPDISIQLDEIICEGDSAAVRWRLRGTHTGSGLGLKASGKKFESVGTTWLRFRNGKIVEGFDTWNLGALLESLSQ